jgi:hypothetical protein
MSARVTFHLVLAVSLIVFCSLTLTPAAGGLAAQYGSPTDPAEQALKQLTSGMPYQLVTPVTIIGGTVDSPARR